MLPADPESLRNPPSGCQFGIMALTVVDRESVGFEVLALGDGEDGSRVCGAHDHASLRFTKQERA